MLSNFRVEKKIGRGQFSEVYKATCLLDNQRVALKKVQVNILHLPIFRIACYTYYFCSMHTSMYKITFSVCMAF